MERALDSGEARAARVPAAETADWEQRPKPVTSASAGRLVYSETKAMWSLTTNAPGVLLVVPERDFSRILCSL